MVRIRLRRVGAKKQPSYRVVVADQRTARDGRFIEDIGHYNPRTDPPTVKIDEERAKYWLAVGAKPSKAVARMLEDMGLLGDGETAAEGKEVEAEEVSDQEAESETDKAVEEEAEDQTEDT
ncbi:MAG: 30S ribosomal protein S16 [Chloroflexota bacterium]|nr:30S ribosomal protein S16 [Chloroflexota bacterium]